MNIILKHTVKNIINKPFRTFVLIFCITVTAVSAYLMLDMNNSLSSAMSSLFPSIIGNANVLVSSDRGLYDKDFEGVPEYEAMKLAVRTENLYKRRKKHYSYVFTETAGIFGINPESAYNMGILKEKLELADNETAISKTFAKKFKYKVGDTLIFHDKNDKPIEYRLVKILPENSGLINWNTCNAVVNMQAMSDLNAGEKVKIDQMYVDVKDDSQIEEFIDKVKKNAPYVECNDLTGGELLKEAISQMTSLFALIFIVAFLLVIFITISLSNRIICERMSVIGTLRSLGISGSLTAFVLLLENIIYGLAGACIGTYIYRLIRFPLLDAMVSFDEGFDATPVLDDVSVWSYVAVFAGAVLVECVSPIFALTKAVRTAIRDIIFANKDTEYVLSKKQTILGFIFLTAGIIADVLGTEKMTVLAVSLICIVFALALLMPAVLKIMSKVLSGLFSKLKSPVASLASSEICSKKSTVSSAVLCATALCLSVTIFIISTSISAMFQTTGYKADVLMFGGSLEKYMYSFIKDIDGVTAVEYMYHRYDTVDIDGERMKEEFNIKALPNKEFFDTIPDYPDSLEENEFVMDKRYAKKFDFEIGDTINLTLNAEGVFPITKVLTLTGYVNTSNYDTSMPVLIINKDVFIEVYHDYPTQILVKGDNPEYIVRTIETYVSNACLLYTAESYRQQNAENGSSMKGILSFLMILGVLLTVIGTSGNQIIGFEGRRREYAVMYSTSMNRKQIKRLIFLENMISTGISVFVAVCTSRFLMSLVGRILDTIDMAIEIQVNFSTYITAGIVFWIIMMFTCLSPMRSLHNMNIASELKYE